MIRYLISTIIISLLPFTQGYAQGLDTKSTAFLDWFFNTQRKVGSGTNFYLANGISENEIKELTTCISADTLFHLSQSLEEARSPRFLILSDKQKNYLLKSIKKLSLNSIPKGNLSNMQLMDSVKFNLIFKNSNRTEVWNNAYKSKVFGYYSFMAPISFGRKYFLFKYNYSCGWLCGDGKTMIYRKTKTGWKPWIELANWIS